MSASTISFYSLLELDALLISPPCEFRLFTPASSLSLSPPFSSGPPQPTIERPICFQTRKFQQERPSMAEGLVMQIDDKSDGDVNKNLSRRGTLCAKGCRRAVASSAIQFEIFHRLSASRYASRFVMSAGPRSRGDPGESARRYLP